MTVRWQYFPVLSLGYQQSKQFYFPASSKLGTGVIELASPDCYVQWSVTTVGDDVIPRVEHFQTGPVSTACFDVPEDSDITVESWVVYRQSDWPIPSARCHITPDGIQARNYTLSPFLPAVAPATLIPSDPVAPVERIVARFIAGVSAKQWRGYQLSQPVTYSDTMSPFGSAKEFGITGQNPPNPQVFYVSDGLDSPAIFPVGYRRKVSVEYPDEFATSTPPGGSLKFFYLSPVDNGVSFVKGVLDGVPTEEQEIHAWDAVAAFLATGSGTVDEPRSGLPLFFTIR